MALGGCCCVKGDIGSKYNGKEDTSLPEKYSHEQLFSNYQLPSSSTDIPFAAARTLDVDGKAWNYYAGHGPFTPRGRMERLASQSLSVAGRGMSCLCCNWSKSRSPFISLFGLPVLGPGHLAVRIWDGFMTFVDMTYSAFLVSISLAFDTMEGGHFTWLTWTDVVGTTCYLLDVLMGFHVGFVVRYDVRQVLVRDGLKVAYYYVLHGQFLINFVACLPIVPEVVTSALPHSTSSAYKGFYVLRLLRMLRVTRLLRMVWGASLLYNPCSRAILSWTNTAALYIMTVLLTLAILVNLLGCIWWFVAELEGLENSWAAHNSYRPDGSLVTAHPTTQYVASIFYVMTTMTTVGYGDISPVTVAEQLVAMGFMSLSVFYFGFVVNVVGDLIHYASGSARSGDVLRNKLEDMDAWMAERHLSSTLKEKVRQYYVEVWAQHKGAGMPEAEYFDDLPVALRGEIVLSLADEALAQSHMFRMLSREVRAQVAASAVPVRLVAGHNLYEEGDKAEGFYVLQEGEAVAIHGMKQLVLYHSPALLGQSSVFANALTDCQHRQHTVRATTNCTLWQFSAHLLNKLSGHHPEIMMAICASYIEYLDEMTAMIERRGRRPPKRLARVGAQVRRLYHEAWSRTSQRSADGREREEVERLPEHSSSSALHPRSSPRRPNKPPSVRLSGISNASERENSLEEHELALQVQQQQEPVAGMPTHALTGGQQPPPRHSMSAESSIGDGEQLKGSGAWAGDTGGGSHPAALPAFPPPRQQRMFRSQEQLDRLAHNSGGPSGLLQRQSPPASYQGLGVLAASGLLGAGNEQQQGWPGIEVQGGARLSEQDQDEGQQAQQELAGEEAIPEEEQLQDTGQEQEEGQAEQRSGEVRVNMKTLAQG